MLRRRLPHGTRLLALVALLATLVVAGCGGEDETTSGAGPDPAAATPTDAFVYAELVVRPTGELEENANAALRKVLRVDDPGAELRRVVDELLAEGGGEMTWAEDVEPWLGERIAFFATPPAAGDDEPGWAAIGAIRDTDAYDEMVARWRDDGWFRPAGTYRGVAYDEDVEHETGFSARVGDLSVTGSEPALRAAIDASRGESLADTSRYEDASDDVDDALAFLYVDPQAIAEGLSATEDVDPQLRRALGSSQLAEADPVVASLTANADEIAFEATAGSALTGDALDAGGDTEVTVGELPGDAWLALATPPLGPTIRQVLDVTGALEEAQTQVRQSLGLDLGRDLLDPLGGLGLFIRGSSPLAIGGGVLRRTTSAASATRLVTMVESIVGASGVGPMRPLSTGGARGFQVVVPQSPQPIVVLAKGAEIAAGYSASSAQDLLDPQQRFDESSDGSAAIATLGDGFEPSFVLIVPPVAGLLRSLDQLQVADLSEVIPYVNAYQSLAVGIKQDGDETTVRAVAALR